MRRPVRNMPLVTQVSTQFRELIASGQWPVGEKVPGEHELAEDLGVSRATVREALRGLSIIGLLEPRIGDGTYVRAADEIAGVLTRDTTATALSEVLDARAALESASARLAARHASPDALDELERILSLRSAAHDSGDSTAYTQADAAFHRAVVHASGNAVLIRFHTAVEELIAQSIEETSVLPEPPAIGEAHRLLVQAIREGDPQRAADVSHGLIESVKQVGSLESTE